MSGEVVSITEAARRLDCSVRTVQRRLDAGELEPVEVAGKRCVRLSSDVPSDAPSDKREAARGTSRDDRKNGTSVEGRRQNDAPHDKSSGTSHDVERDAKRDMTAHLIEENRFLRSALEARDRDAAELRAALREALKLQTRALPESSSQSVQKLADEQRDDGTMKGAENRSNAHQTGFLMRARRTARRWIEGR
jgi:excisionase family DNA binding protein